MLPFGHATQYKLPLMQSCQGINRLSRLGLVTNFKSFDDALRNFNVVLHFGFVVQLLAAEICRRNLKMFCHEIDLTT